MKEQVGGLQNLLKLGIGYCQARARGQSEFGLK